MLYIFLDSFVKRFMGSEISFIPQIFLAFVLIFLLHAVPHKLDRLIHIDITSIIGICLKYQDSYCFTQKYGNRVI